MLLVFFAGNACLHHIEIIYSFHSQSPAVFYPTEYMQLLPNDWLSLNPEYKLSLKVTTVILSIGGIFGIFGRGCLLMLSLVLFYVFGFNSAYGIFDHHNSLSSQVIFILALIPGSMMLSVDILILNWFKQRRINITQALCQPWPSWGFKLILIVVALTYFTSGLSKIRFGGLGWMDGNTLSFYLSDFVNENPQGLRQMIIGKEVTDEDEWKDNFGLHAHIYGNQHRGILADIGAWLSEHKLIIALAASVTVIFEISAPVVLINNRWRTFYLAGAIVMHTTIGALMGLGFIQYRIICFCLMDWKYSLEVLKRSTWNTAKIVNK